MVSYQNIHLIEAAENAKPAEIAASIKRQLLTCKLTKFKSTTECAKFYSAFFLQTIEDVEYELTVDDWGIIYNQLFADEVFTEALCIFIVIYRPITYSNIFKPLFNMVKEGFKTAGKRKVLYLGNAKALFSMLQMRFQAVSNVISTQVRDPDTIKFLTVIDQTLQQMIFELYHMIQSSIEQAADPNDIAPAAEPEPIRLEEDAREIIDLLEHADAWVKDYMSSLPMNEGIVNNAKEKAKELAMNKQKAEKAFDDFVMKKYRNMTINRRNRKHSEMVGESLRIMRELKRLMKSGILGIILHPAIGIIHWIVTLFIDKKTDKKDRAVLIGEIKDELEIIEEKISMAERNGDDKAKIDLIRYRQKLQKEYERILHVKFDKSRMNNANA